VTKNKDVLTRETEFNKVLETELLNRLVIEAIIFVGARFTEELETRLSHSFSSIGTDLEIDSVAAFRMPPQ